MAATMHTIAQGPLAYEKPKGLAALLVPVLCPPTDFISMQKILRSGIRGFIAISIALMSLSFIVFPAWLWLIRHELVVGHTEDAVLITVGGLLLFLATDATNKAVTSAAAARRRSLLTAEATRTSLRFTRYQLGSAPPAGVPTPGPSSSTAGARGVAGPATSNGVSVAPRSQVGLANSSQDPMIRQVKQRIIRLEHLVFGNELTEANLSPDSLHSRVLALCTEVGVPFSGPSSSGGRPTAAELDLQLQLLERELLGTS